MDFLPQNGYTNNGELSQLQEEVTAMPLEDKRTRLLVEREVRKRSLDTTLLTVACINEVIYLGGVIKRLRGPLGRGVDLRQEMVKIEDAIIGMPGVRDVVCDVRYA